jgi:glycosyltransferase involved in cell wall biosynthesis
MPVYNACRINRLFLLRALESIAKQTYRNLELVIVDDGSTDDTRQVCEDFLSRNPDLRAQYLSKPNGGQSAARNFGAKACSGEYVGFLDQDDEWYANKLEQVVPWLSNKSIDVLYTDSDVIDGDDQVTLSCIHVKHKYGWPHPKTAIEDILFKDIFVMPGLMTIRKSAFDAVAGFDENLSGYEDDDLFLRLFEKFRIFYLPIPTLSWRMYGDNYSFSHRMLTSRVYYWKKLLANHTRGGRDRLRVHMISLRFFWQFMGQAKAQFELGNDLCWSSLSRAREMVSSLPIVQRILFAAIFRFPDRMVLPFLVRSRAVVRGG